MGGDDEEEYEAEYEETSASGLRPVKLSWRLPGGAFLECISDLFTAVAAMFHNFACAVLAHQLHVEEQVTIHTQASLELETLIKGD